MACIGHNLKELNNVKDSLRLIQENKRINNNNNQLNSCWPSQSEEPGVSPAILDCWPMGVERRPRSCPNVFNLIQYGFEDAPRAPHNHFVKYKYTSHRSKTSSLIIIVFCK